MRIGYFDGNAVDYLNLEVLINGIQLEWDNFVIHATSPNLKMFDWLYIALWRQEPSWHLLVGQNSQYYLANPASDNDYPMRGISNIQLVGSNANGVQFFIRDLFISDGREFDKDNINITVNKFFNHGCYNFVSVPHEFAVSSTPAESQFYFPLTTDLDDTLGGISMLYRTGTVGNYYTHDVRDSLSRSNAADSLKGIEVVDFSALSQAQIFILPNSPNIPPNQPNSAVGPLIPNGMTLEGQIFVENSVFNLSIRVNSHRDVDGSNEHGVYFTAGNSGWTSSIKVAVSYTHLTLPTKA